MNSMSHDLSLPPNRAIEQLDPQTMIQENIEIALGSLSDKNRLEYERTFQYWTAFAQEQQVHNYDFQLALVKQFITENDWSFNTQKTRLAHLKKFAQILAMSDSDGSRGYAFNYGRLSLLKPKNLTGQKTVHKPHHLSQKQVYSIFDAWRAASNKATRNRAILGVMLLAGLRAFEVAKLQWDDLHFDENLIYVRDGKGEKSAYVPMLGDLPQLLKAWRNKSSGFQFVSVAINKGDKLMSDKPMTTQSISNLISATCQRTGLEFSPHDTRRTFISDLASRHDNIKDIQTIARHANADTTLGYVEEKDARTLGAILKGKLSYGDIHEEATDC